MKKTLSLILALVLCLSLCACTSLESKVGEKVKEYVADEVESTYICVGVEVEIDSLTSTAEDEFLVTGSVSGQFLNNTGFRGTFTVKAEVYHYEDHDSIYIADCEITGID